MSHLLIHIGYLGAALALAGSLALNSYGRTIRQLPRWSFAISAALYLLGYLTWPMAWVNKFPFLFSEALLLGVFGFIFKQIHWRAVRPVAVVTLLLIGLSGYGAWRFHAISKLNTAAEPALAADAELLLELQEGIRPEVLQTIELAFDLKLSPAFSVEAESDFGLRNYYTVDVPDALKSSLPHIKKTLAAHPHVLWLEDNEVIQIELLKDKKPPTKTNKYGLNDPQIGMQWGFEAMQVDQLFQWLNEHKIRPRKKARLFILDTGVDAQHEDLAANYRSHKKQYDNDPHSHGTHCAGIAAAVSNNGVGIASLSMDNTFLQVSSIKVLNANGSGTQQGIIQGILEAADNGADVISLSLGGFSNQSRQRAYDKAIAYATKKGAIVVAAAGNSNRNAKDYVPANVSGVIAVSAVDQELNRAVFSNYVSDLKMAVAAPGVGIYSTIPGEKKYASYNGTSMATPMVASLVAMMRSLQPDLSAEKAWQLMNQHGAATKSTELTGKFIQPMPTLRACSEIQ